MRILDLFSGAGGAAAGYHEAGFDIIGVDHKAQQNWPFPQRTFVKMDALAAFDLLDLSHYDAIHASPPCQTHSVTRYMHEDRPEGQDLLAQTRERLIASGKPYVIENVVGAPLRDPLLLCGSMFEQTKGVRRHRLFECSFAVPQPKCEHERQQPRFVNPDIRGAALTSVVNVHGNPTFPGEAQLRREVMGIDWMTNQELTQAIPPAYTRFIGAHLRAHLAPVLPALTPEQSDRLDQGWGPSADELRA